MTNRQRVFVEEYLRTWNATESARIAGYAFPNVEGPKNLVNPSIKALVDQRLAAKVMSADEVLVRLAEHARNDAAKYTKVDAEQSPYIDVAEMIRDGKAHLIKGISYTRSGEVMVELPDSQAALVHVGRHLKLFTDKQEVEHSGNKDNPLVIGVRAVDYRSGLETLKPLEDE